VLEKREQMVERQGKEVKALPTAQVDKIRKSSEVHKMDMTLILLISPLHPMSYETLPIAGCNGDGDDSKIFYPGDDDVFLLYSRRQKWNHLIREWLLFKWVPSLFVPHHHAKYTLCLFDN
jgi:hypothetical protein